MFVKISISIYLAIKSKKNGLKKKKKKKRQNHKPEENLSVS